MSTTHDYLVSKYVAGELLRTYITDMLSQMKKQYQERAATQLSLKWTGSKVGLVELIYALQIEGVFNNGKAALQETVRVFESAFDVDLGQFHRVFIEIRNRKNDRAKFLNGLVEGLVRKMEDGDE